MRTAVGSLALLLRGVWRVLPQRSPRPRSVPTWRAPRPADTRSPALRTGQRLIGGAGVLVMVWGVVLLVTTVPVTVPRYLSLAIWLGGAIVLHDGVLVPLITLLRAGLQRVGRSLPRSGIALIQGGFVVGAVLSLTAVPEIYGQSLGTRNPTVLPSAYGLNLGLTWLTLVLGAGIANGVLVVVARGRARRRRAVGPDGL